MKEDPQLRRGSAADAPDIARLVISSAESFLPAVFGPRIAGVLTSLAAGRGTLFSHEHAWIAESEGRTLGMLLGYPGAVKSAEDPRTGFALLRLLGVDLLARLGTLLRTQSAIGRIGRDEYYVSNVAVDEAHRGRGVGTLLIARAAREAREAGARTVVLDVESDNSGARRLYERLGFRPVAETPAITIAGRSFSFFRYAMPSFWELDQRP